MLYRVYLDNCCLNRPYDDQSHLKIEIETKAKLRIQEMIVLGRLEMATSYILEYENSDTHRVCDWNGGYVDERYNIKAICD